MSFSIELELRGAWKVVVDCFRNSPSTIGFTGTGAGADAVAACAVADAGF